MPKTDLVFSELLTLPLHPDVMDFVARHRTVIVLEANRDGQLFGIMRKEYPYKLIGHMHSAAFSDGMPPRAKSFVDKIMEVLKEVGQ